MESDKKQQVAVPVTVPAVQGLSCRCQYSFSPVSLRPAYREHSVGLRKIDATSSRTSSAAYTDFAVLMVRNSGTI
jgi:hypothetical protein